MSRSPTEHRVPNADRLDEDGARITVDVDGQEITVFRYDGEYYAVLNFCVHQAGPLCEGRLTGRMTTDEDGWEWTYDDEEKHVVCPWHGWKFDITDGTNVSDSRYVVPTYDVEKRDGELYIVR